MKGGNLNGLKGKHFLLIIFALVCITLLLCAWDRSPLVTSMLEQQDLSEIDSQASVYYKRKGDDVQPNVGGEERKSPNIDYIGNSVEEDPSHAGVMTDSEIQKLRQTSFYYNKGTESNLAEIEQTQIDNLEDVSIISENITTFGSFEQDLSSVSEENGDSLQPTDCNYAKGKWVKHDRRPLYSGYGCKQWLSEMWACRLTQRTDFSYEKFRWQPKYCDMPEFEGPAFLAKMQNKTLAFIGDSLGRQQFQSMMCMITGGKENLEVVDVGEEYGLIKAPGAIRPDGWVYRFLRTNTTILYYWSASLCELEPVNISDPQTEFAMHLDRPATFIQKYLDRFDVLVLNTGHHWNRGKLKANRWIMYVAGKPNLDRHIAEIGNAKNFTVHSVVKWLNLQLPKHPRLKVFFRTISPRHFVNGDWNTGGSCDNTIPLNAGSEVLQLESSDQVAESAVSGTAITLLDITALSQLRDECHISKYSAKATEGVQDCLHWCLPGVPDTWNEILSAQI